MGIVDEEYVNTPPLLNLYFICMSTIIRVVDYHTMVGNMHKDLMSTDV